LGFARLPPLCRSTFSASTPGSRGSLRPDETSRRVTFRPRGLSPPRRLSPRWGCGFVAPRCRLWSSTRFLLPASPLTRGWMWMVVAFPASRVIPFEEFPSSAAVPHHCGRCPLDVSTRSPRPDCPTLRSSGGSCAGSRGFRFRAGTRVGRGPRRCALHQAPRRLVLRAPPAAEASGGARATVDRGRRWCCAPPVAEAADGAHARAGRSRRGRLWPRAACAVRGGPASPPKRTADRSGLRRPDGRRPGPEGPGAPPATEVVVGVHRPPRWRDGGGEPGLCLGDAPIRRSGPPRHQTGLESTGKPAASAPFPRVSPSPEGGGLPCRGDVPSERAWPC
jgi:hypothetical protein